MNLASLKWYVSRLAAMSWSERLHRVEEAYRRKTVQLDVPLTVKSERELVTFIDFSLVSETSDAEFCSSTPSSPGNRIEIYGQDWPLGSSGLPNWHQLLNGTDTSATPTFKVHYRNSVDLKDDVRINWELNRLTWLIPSAVQAHRSNDPAKKQYVAEVIQSFLDTDRVGYSSRWSSSIEVAMQSLSLIILSSLIDTASMSPQMHERLSGAVLRRYEWMERFPSKFSSANNHLLAELAALCVISRVVPALHSSHEKHVNDFLETASDQFNDDGLNAELATDYHLYALDLLLTVLYLGNQADNAKLATLTKNVAQATYKVVEFCGFWPRISDSDHAAVLSNVVAEPDRAIWLSRFAEQLLNIKLTEPNNSTLSFNTSGYTFLKSSSEVGDVLVLADHGYLGYGDIAAHAHADSGAIWVWVNRKPVLIESGTYSYHSRDDLRDAFRSSMWHNTISINGTSTSTSDGPFLWIKKKRATARLLSLSENSIEIEVEIPKTPALESKVIHTRNVTLNGATIVVTDSVKAKEPFETASHIILADEFNQVSHDDKDVIHLKSISGGGLSVTFNSAELSPEVDEIETSSTYGKLEQSKRVTLSNKQTAREHVLTYTLSYHTSNN